MSNKQPFSNDPIFPTLSRLAKPSYGSVPDLSPYCDGFLVDNPGHGSWASKRSHGDWEYLGNPASLCPIRRRPGGKLYPKEPK